MNSIPPCHALICIPWEPICNLWDYPGHAAPPRHEICGRHFGGSGVGNCGLLRSIPGMNIGTKVFPIWKCHPPASAMLPARVTDAWLARLAAKRNGVLGAFDAALARRHPEQVRLLPCLA